MIWPALMAASVATAATPSQPAVAPPQAATAQPTAPLPSLGEIEHAIDAGRLEQAKLMVARSVAAGISGPQIDRILADLAFASGKYDEALLRYRQLLAANPNDSRLAERTGISALKQGDVTTAAPYIDRATKAAKPSWRAWNARGVVADLQQDWRAADAAYGEAADLAPGEADVVNNQGWSRLLRGDWKRAVGLFERAAGLDPGATRIANNLELARAAMAGELPGRKANETDRAWAARLNDAGMAAQLMGDRRRAVAAFTQALETSGIWYARAANNLQAAGGR
ncbi:MAG TPA: tetratricopeptide repeat protein [Sphingomicrobium sp.]|nr:tetratricopeptide repeat protein [Sphingomicrobium sp.]